MDRLEAMAVLLKVADRGGFSAAARELGMPLTSVSRKVSELESHLGVQLLVRTTRKVSPTEAGVVYVASARRILEQVDETERAAAGEFQSPRGELVLTAPILFGRLHILPVVADFLAAFPEINVRLLLSDRNLHLLDEHVDMAVRIGPLPDSTLVATRIGSIRTVVCARPDLFMEANAPRSPQDLAALPCVNFEALSPSAAWRFCTRDPASAMEVEVRPRLSVSSAEAAVWAAIRGVGVTRVLHYQCADALRDGALRILLPEFEVEPAPVHLIHAQRGALPSKMRVFLDFAAGRLRARLASL